MCLRKGMMKAHSGWLIQEIAINSHGIYAARPVGTSAHA